MRVKILPNEGNFLSVWNAPIPIENIGVYLIPIIGFLLAATQVFGTSPDYSNYDIFFDLARSEGLGVLIESRFEPGFSIFSILLAEWIDSNVIVYALIVAAAMLLKGWAVQTYSLNYKIFFIVLAFYMVRYFPLHELTQLRAACAISLALAGAIVLWQGNFIFGALVCIIASIFHFSVVAVIPALLFFSNKRWKVAFIAFCAFNLTYFFTALITEYSSDLIKIIEVYKIVGFGDVDPNPLAIQLLIDWTLIFVSLISWNKLSLLMKRIVLFELIGMAIFYGGMEFAVIAHRMREFYSVFWVFFVADGLRRSDTRLMSYIFICISMIFYSYVFFINGTFFE